MEQKVHCLVGASYADITDIPMAHTVVITSEFTKFKRIDEIIQFEQDKTHYSDFFNHDVPFTQIERLLQNTYPLPINIKLITPKIFNLKFLRMNEMLMNLFPQTSFFLRNCVVEQEGNKYLLQNQKCNFFITSLYKNDQNLVTINV